MLITFDSNRTVPEISASLPEICKRHGFGLLHTHDLRAKLIEKGQEFDRACLVFDVCNPVKAKTVLDCAPQVSAVLPCRISVYETGGVGSKLVTVRPTMMMRMFQVSGLEKTAVEVEESLRAIMNEAAG